MSGRQFTLSNGTNGRPKRFSIDDAFEEETDEAIRVYGTVGIMSDKQIGDGDCTSINMESSRWVNLSLGI